MPLVADCIIEAGHVLSGLDRDGTMTVIPDAGIRIAGGMIAEIAPLASLSGVTQLSRYGSRDTIAIPGLVNSHHHSGLTPLMMGVPFAPLELWLPQFRAMRSIGPRLDTLYSAIEMLESGTTGVHHIHGGVDGTPENWAATGDAVLGAYAEIGMRTGFSFMMRDRNILTYDSDDEVLASLPPQLAGWLGPQLAPRHVPTADYMDFFRRQKRKWESSGLARLHLAPANLHWCSDDSLVAMFATARAESANLHMHLVETERQAQFAHRKFGHSAVAHLHELGCLGPELTLGHGNWQSHGDLDLIAECGCSICHNASSGLRLGSGIAPVNQMRQRGIQVALGIDQSNIFDDRDMLAEIKLVWALHRETGLWNDRPTAAHVLQMATEHGARTIGFGDIAGRLEVGRTADIVLLSREAVERPAVNRRTPISETVLHRATKSAIDKVFVAGRLVVDHGKVVSIDRDAVMAEIRSRLTAPETPQEAEAAEMMNLLVPALETWHRARTPSDSYRPYRYNLMND